MSKTGKGSLPQAPRSIASAALLATLRAHNVRPSKKLGQHFLLDLDVVDASVEAAHVGLADTVLEIGPGPGVLTQALVERAGRVVAIELDRDMLRVLAPLRRDHPNLELVEGNAIAIPPEELVGAGPYKIVANLPYYITSAALRYYLEASRRPELMVLLVQREVAERICAAPGDLSLLSLSVQLYAAPEILRFVPPDSFFPRPQVESALLRLTLRPRPVVAAERIPLFFLLAQAGFNDRRKQLHNALRINLRVPEADVTRLLADAGIEARRRAETLSLEEWDRLCAAAERIIPRAALPVRS